MADEAPIKLIQIGPKGGEKKDGFNLVTEKVVSVNPAAKQLEVELLAYDGKTVVLDVDDEALEDLKKLKPGDGATIRVVEENGKRIAKSFRIRSKDPNAAKADAMLLDLKDTHWLGNPCPSLFPCSCRMRMNYGNPRRKLFARSASRPLSL
jgi:hypothetical protein